MTQRQFHSDAFRQARKIKVGQGAVRRTSRLALLALLGNALCVLPGVPALMVLLGFKARGRIRRAPLLMKGTGVAWAAVALGLVLTAGQGAVGYLAYKHFDTARGGAALALARGLDGDVESFVDAFTGDGNRVEREIAAQVFLGEAALRFGEMTSARPVSAGVWSPENLRALLVDGEQEFALNFEHGRVRLHVRLGPRSVRPRLASVRLIDHTRGTMTFPGTSRVADHPGH